MAERAEPRTSPLRPFDVDTVALLESVPGEHVDALVQLVRERDNLFHLQEALLAVESAGSLEDALGLFARAIGRIGFGRVVITMRDAALAPTLIVTAGLTPDEERSLRERPEAGATWRRRFEEMARFRISQSYYLDARDPWVQAEFAGSVRSAMEMGDDPEWTPADVFIVPLLDPQGAIIGTLMLDDPEDRRRPTLVRIRTVELFAQQVTYHIHRTQLHALADRRAGRLQRLHEVGATLARSLDERQVVRELARQVARILPNDEILIQHPDVEHRRLTTGLRLVHGVERPAPDEALGDGPVLEVARTGRPVRLDDHAGGGSRLVVPMMVGTRLLGVIVAGAAQRGAYDAEDEEMLLTIGAQAATALHNARLYADAQREQRQSEALADIARAVGESLRLGEVLQLILRHASALLRSEGGMVALKRDDHCEVVAANGQARLMAGMHIPLEGTMCGQVLREGKWLIAHDVPSRDEVYRPAQRVADVRNSIMVPLQTGRGTIGVLGVGNRHAPYTDEDARVLQRLADHVAVAIVNARLFEEVNEATREWTVAFDAVASGLVVLDEAGRVRRGNRRALPLLGATHLAAARGRDFLEALLGVPVAPAARAALAPVLGEGRVVRTTLRSAAMRLYDVTASPHPAGGAVVTFEDVTSQLALAERHRRVVETVSDGIVITDLDRNIAFSNPAAEALFGAGALLGRPIRDFLAPEVRDQLRAVEERALAGHEVRYASTLIRPDGERRDVEVSVAPLREVGEVTGLVATLRDVSDERRARDAVTRSEARYRHLLESATDAIYTMDPRGVFLSANPSTAALTGERVDALVGQPVLTWIAPEDALHAKEAFKRALAGQSSHYECHVVRRDGTRRLLSVTNTPLRDATDDGAGVGAVLGIARDVTDDRERAEALERSEARYTRLVESAPDGIFTLSQDGRFTSVNKALENATGRARAEIVGREFVLLLDPRDRIAAWRTFEEAIATGQPRRLDLRYRSADGSERRASLMASPIADRQGSVSVLGIVRDVTDEKRLTEQLLRQDKLAAIGQLVSGVAHELNNPLAGVMAFAQLLLAGGGLGDEQRRSVETIHQESRRAARIVSNLLTFARQHPPARTATDLNQVLADTLELRRYALRLHEIEVETSFDEQLPLTWADASQLQQVVLNLVGNAEQALMDWDGARRIRIGSRHEGDTIYVTVADSGPGIPEAILAQVFNPFFTTKPVGQGTGLGLSISDGIVREHGGRIRVDSAPGEGATFTVELPVTMPATPGVRAPEASPVPISAARTVLIVEDESPLRGAISSYLSAEGHRPDAVAAVREARDRIAGRRYDVVLLDVHLPDGSGIALWEELRRRDEEMARRVVFMTADLEAGESSALLAATGRPVLRKPFTFDELAQACFVAPAA